MSLYILVFVCRCLPELWPWCVPFCSLASGAGLPVLAPLCAPPAQRAGRPVVAPRAQPQRQGQPWDWVRGAVPQPHGGHRVRAQQLPLWTPLLQPAGTVSTSHFSALDFKSSEARVWSRDWPRSVKNRHTGISTLKTAPRSVLSFCAPLSLLFPAVPENASTLRFRCSGTARRVRLRAEEDIRGGQLIIEYVGEVSIQTQYCASSFLCRGG